MLSKPWLQFSLMTLLLLISGAAMLTKWALTPRREIWQGQQGDRTWVLELTDDRLNLNEDRFVLTISNKGEGLNEQITGTYEQNARALTLYVAKPGRAFFIYTSFRIAGPTGLGYTVFLNWHSQPHEGTEFCFTCCDKSGADHCVVMHRR